MRIDLRLLTRLENEERVTLDTTEQLGYVFTDLSRDENVSTDMGDATVANFLRGLVGSDIHVEVETSDFCKDLVEGRLLSCDFLDYSHLTPE